MAAYPRRAADAIRVFGWLIPGGVRTDPTGQLAGPTTWASENQPRDNLSTQAQTSASITKERRRRRQPGLPVPNWRSPASPRPGMM
jgi:hypothetical protein